MKIIAIMGPSGAGKTTLGNNLKNRLNIEIPRHCTTRKPRKDDAEGFYRYLKHDKYRSFFENKEFLISSGDSNIIDEDHGNFYGILLKDCKKIINNNDPFIIFVSYKDIYTLIELQKIFNIDIINLTFTNIEKYVEIRIKQDIKRESTEKDILRRIKSALEDEKNYGNIVREIASITINTDLYSIDETYQLVVDELKLIDAKKLSLK